MRQYIVNIGDDGTIEDMIELEEEGADDEIDNAEMILALVKDNDALRAGLESHRDTLQDHKRVIQDLERRLAEVEKRKDFVPILTDPGLKDLLDAHPMHSWQPRLVFSCTADPYKQ